MVHKPFVLVVFSFLYVFCHAWILQLDAYNEQCFFEKVEKDTSLAYHFQVVEGGFLDVDIVVKDPENVELYARNGESSGKFNFKSSKAGKYGVCFSNRKSSLTDKKVMFDVLVSQISIGDSGDGGSPETPAVKLTSVNESIEMLGEYLEGIQHEQHYILARNMITNRLSERTNQLVSWWASFHTGMCLAGVTLQIFYLKKFFEVRRMV